MKRLYHYAFVGLVFLLTIILAAFLLLFTDVSFDPAANGHLDSTNAWATGTKLRLSAELAYYKYWQDPERDIQETEKHDYSVHQSVEKLQRSQHEGQVLRNSSSTRIVTSRSPSFTSPLTVNTNSSKEIMPSHHEHSMSPEGAQNSTTAPTHESELPASDATNSHRGQFNYDKTSDAVPEAIGNAYKLKHDDPDMKYDIPTDASTGMDLNSTTEAPILVSDSRVMKWEDDENTENSLEKGYDNEEDDIYADLEDVNEIEEAKNIANAFAGVLGVEKISTLPQTDIDTQHKSGQKINPSLMARASDTNFHMPCPKVYKPVKEIVVASWMKPLLQILSSFEGNQVTLVIANNAYRDVLLNWLISAQLVSKPPLENIIVVSLDHDLYSLLHSRDIPSIQAPFSTVLNTKHRFRRFFELIMMMRLGFMRLINRLGYDCAMYDIDAIILKNPQPLYDKWADVDIIGSRGQLPRELWRRWGVTICIGAVFIRSNSRTEVYWEAMFLAKIKGAAMANDQIRLNYALKELHVQWQSTNQYNKQHDLPALGHSTSSDLSVVVLPFHTICRFGCHNEMRDQYYIWHKGGSRDKKSKMKGAKQGHTWFLKARWNEMSSNMIVRVKGTNWLKRLSNL